MWNKNKRRSVAHTPELVDQLFLDIGILDDEKQEEIRERYERQFAFWINSGNNLKNSTEIGFRMSSFIYKCSSNPLKFAIFADKLDFIKKIFYERERLPDISDHLNLAYFLPIVCVLGSQKVGNWIISQLKLDLKNLDSETRYMLFAHVACSENWDWLKELIVKSGAERMPGSAYRFTGYLGWKKLEEIEAELNLQPSPDKLPLPNSIQQRGMSK